MTRNDIADFLEELRQALAEPWTLEADLIRFFESPAARDVVRGGEPIVRELLDVVEGNASSSLKRAAVLALSRFPPELFYAELLAILESGDADVMEVFDAGLWLVRLPPDRIAHDLVELVKRSRNPHPLLLLQRPAAGTVKSDLAAFIEGRNEPLTRYALWAYSRALDADDVPFLTSVASQVDALPSAVIAAVDLLQLGSTAGLEAIDNALRSDDEELRSRTYSDVSRFVPASVLTDARYDPTHSASTQKRAIEGLITALAERRK